MLKNTIASIFIISTLFVQCKKDDSTAPEQVADTVIMGKVYVFDQYGMPVSPAPQVEVRVWPADSSGAPLGASRSVASAEDGTYRIDSLAVGLYSVRYSALGYGDYVANGIRFDSLGAVILPDVKLTSFASGSVYINDISLSLKRDSETEVSAIANIDRSVTFGAGASAPFQLKVRYFFGLDSSVLTGNCLFSYVSGAAEGASGSVDSQIVKFGLPNLKTHFPDSSLIYVAAAVETVPSQIYSMGEKIYYPNIAFPLSNCKTITFVLNAGE